MKSPRRSGAVGSGGICRCEQVLSGRRAVVALPSACDGAGEMANGPARLPGAWPARHGPLRVGARSSATPAREETGAGDGGEGGDGAGGAAAPAREETRARGTTAGAARREESKRRWSWAAAARREEEHMSLGERAATELEIGRTEMAAARAAEGGAAGGGACGDR